MKTPRKALSKAYLKAPISRSEIEQFKTAFITLQEKIDVEETEEHLKNNIRDFLLDSYYKGNYAINVKDRKDLVIHNGPKTADDVGVIIEAKSLKNKSEMVSREQLNAKALQELLRYYLNERVDQGNIKLKQLIITNANEWYIFDATQWEQLIYNNKKLVKSYKEYTLSGHSTSHFYTEIAKPFIETIKDQLEYTWFDISKYKTIITNDDLHDDKKLIALFKLLSPTHLLKQPFSNDSNSLNKNFYNELLHIIGLEEVSQKGKKVIQRKAEDKREPASLLENTINILQYETRVPASQHFDTALELCITWINRVLFLKLLESQIVSYQRGDESYRFLDYQRIGNYDALNKLFFQVLAIKPELRRPRVQEEYSKVPYLNSSLFEVSDIEGRTLKISGLEDDGALSIHGYTVLKGDKGKRAKGELPTLAYLFRFLEAYNFSSEGSEQIQDESKTLINASVLGLIFEKINGYKDGSFFTPGFITMYMCRETIRRSVMQKFREVTNYDSEEWNDLRNYIGRPYKAAELQQYNELINDIKICDPAVGSGHFLVSALNEIISIKSELGILCSPDYQKLPVLATIDNDELILEYDDADHSLYEYDYQSKESQLVQQSIFHEKKRIIENCLFGVDINPNSVKICRLRLWIELLKNAYYTHESSYTDLETLPNIDINIKCGNSLISRFSLDSDLKPALKKSKFTIDSYKAAVQSYKSATDKEEKRAFMQLIDTIKGDFKSEVGSKDKLQLQKLEGQFYERFGATTLIDVELSKTEQKKKAKEQKKLLEKIDKKKAEIEEIQHNKIYEQAFEWRFEFPEVLDEEGVYQGFDVVIGNPPYINFSYLNSDISSYLKKDKLYKNKTDLYAYFVKLSLRITNTSALNSMIIPHTWSTTTSFLPFRLLLLKKRFLFSISELNMGTFKDAAVKPVIIFYSKNHQDKVVITNENFIRRSEIPYSFITRDDNLLFDLRYSEIKGRMFKKIESNSTRLGRVIHFSRGIKTSNDKRFLKFESLNKEYKKVVRGRNISKHSLKYNGEYIWYRPDLMKEKAGSLPHKKSLFEQNIKIITQRVNSSNQLFAVADNEEFYCLDTTNVSQPNELTVENIIYICCLINSKLINYWFNGKYKNPTISGYELHSIPYKFKLDKIQLIGEIGTQIIALKKEGKETQHLEDEIDVLVYRLYGLTYTEVLVVDPDFGMREEEYAKMITI